MQNIVIDMYEKFHNDRLRNDRALVLWKSDNNNLKSKHKKNVRSVWGPLSESKNVFWGIACSGYTSPMLPKRRVANKARRTRRRGVGRYRRAWEWCRSF